MSYTEFDPDKPVTNMAVIVAALSGMRYAPGTVPSSATVFPCAFVYWVQGNGVPVDKYFHEMTLTMAVDIFLGTMPDWGRALKRGTPYVELLATAICQDPTLGNTIDSMTGWTWRLEEREHGGIKFLVMRFDISFEEHTAT